MILIILFVIIFIFPSAMKTADDNYKTNREKEQFRKVLREENKRGNRW